MLTIRQYVGDGMTLCFFLFLINVWMLHIFYHELIAFMIRDHDPWVHDRVHDHDQGSLRFSKSLKNHLLNVRP